MRNQNHFELEGVQYEAVARTTSCKGCAFENSRLCYKAPACGQHFRKDKRSVIFVRDPIQAASDQAASTAKYLDLSTSHLREDTVNPPHPGYLVASYTYGAFYYVPEEIDDENTPEELVAVLQLAKSLGCTLVRFDADGAVLDGLKVYDWQ